MLAKTAAAGSTVLHPEVLRLTSSLAPDRALIREDVVGSLAHLTMLARGKLIPAESAAALKAGLVAIGRDAAAGTLVLPDEEDVHMAVEAELGTRVGAHAGFLHTARSRNDQVALDLRLHVREVSGAVLAAVGGFIGELADRAQAERDTLMPAYTHRQRAQPISAAYWLLGLAAALERDVAMIAFSLDQTDSMPLGVGAISGSSLPIDRELVRALLGFARLTRNGLDTVGDRDFAIDWSYTCARLLGHASRFATDVIDFSSREFGFIKLDGEIACGSSMMPQKKNPDVFELVRGKAGIAIGDLVALLATMKGLPGGYNRDLQEDRGPLLACGRRAYDALALLRLALPRIQIDAERCRAALAEDATQSTDLAEVLVARGLPFRSAYKLVGALVRRAQEAGVTLETMTPTMALEVDAAFDQATIDAARVAGSVARKRTEGGTGPASIDAQIEAARGVAEVAIARASALPTLDALLRSLEEAPL